MRLVVLGDVGFRHVGDEAMFEVALARLRARWPEAEITAMSCAPAATAAQFGTAAVLQPCHARTDEAGALFSFQRALDAAAAGAAGAWLREIDDLHASVAAIRNADAVVIAGGGNMHARWPHLLYGRAAALAIAQAQGIPTALTSQTIGPALTPTQRSILRDVLGRAVITGVREPFTATLLAELGISKDCVSRQPDDALALTPRPASRWLSSGGRPVILVTFGDGGTVDLQQAVLERIVALADREKAVVALCPHMPLDAERHAELAAKLRRRDRIRQLPLSGAAETRWMVSAASLVVTTRYHPLVFAVAAAVPAIGLYHDDYTRVRMAGALDQGRLEDFSLDLRDAEERLDEVLTRAFCNRAEMTEVLEKARPDALRELESHWEKLCASIAPAVKSPSWSRSRAALPTSRARVTVPSLSLVVHPLRLEGGEAVATARLEGEGLAPAEVYFRVPAEAADPAVLGDAFLLAFLFPVMKLGRDLHVRSGVSPSLIQRLGDYQGVWQCWRPATYRRVQITADAVVERPPVASRATLFGFSSGTDSSYAGWQVHQAGKRGSGD